MREHLKEIAWDEQFLKLDEDTSVENLWAMIKNKLLDLRNKFVPKKGHLGNLHGRPSALFQLKKTCKSLYAKNAFYIDIGKNQGPMLNQTRRVKSMQKAEIW